MLMKQMHLEKYDVMNKDHVEIEESPKKKKKKKKKKPKEEEAPSMLEGDDHVDDLKEDLICYNFDIVELPQGRET